MQTWPCLQVIIFQNMDTQMVVNDWFAVFRAFRHFHWLTSRKIFRGLLLMGYCWIKIKIYNISVNLNSDVDYLLYFWKMISEKLNNYFTRFQQAVQKQQILFTCIGWRKLVFRIRPGSLVFNLTICILI